MLSRRTMLGGSAALLGSVVGGCGSPLVGAGHASGTGDSRLNWNYEKLGEIGRVALFGLAWSPDGEFIASSGVGGTIVCLWHVASKRRVWELHRLSQGMGSNRSLCFTTDGQYLITSAVTELEHGYLALVDAKTGAVVHSIDAPSGSIISSHRAGAFALSPDGKYLASTPLAVGHADLIVYDATNWTVKRTLPFENGTDRDFAFDPVTGALATQTVWMPEIEAPYKPIGKFTRVPRTDGVEIWNLESGEIVQYFPAHPGSIHALRYAPGTQTLLTAAEGVFHQPDPAHPEPPDPNNSELVRAWDVNSGRRTKTFRGDLRETHDIAIDPSLKIVVCSSLHLGLVIWDYQSTELLGTQYNSFPDLLMKNVAFSPDGSRLAFTSENAVYVGKPLKGS